MLYGPSEAILNIGQPAKLLDMRDGYPQARNVIGFSDPSVHFIDGQWTMFIGGLYLPNLKTNIFCLKLPKDVPLSSDDWHMETIAEKPRTARKIVEQPPRGSWNRFMHSVCYVTGEVNGEKVERIYHAGRNTEWLLSENVPYRIGYMEKRDGVWECETAPLPLHSDDYPNVLEPKVEYLEGKWRMRFLTIPVKLTSKNWPDYTLLYTESEDGVTNWSPPKVFTSSEEGYFDSVVLPYPQRSGYIMALTRDSNLSSRSPYPKQGVWLCCADELSSQWSAWSEPYLVVDPDKDVDGWYANGMCSPTMQWGNTPQDSYTLYIFFVTATKKMNWFKESLQRVLAGKRPLLPAPFYFAIGRVAVAFKKQN